MVMTTSFGNIPRRCLSKYLQKFPEDSLYRMEIFAPFTMKRNDRFYNFLKISNLKLSKCRQISPDVVLGIKGLNNLSTSIAPQLTSLSSFMSKEAKRRCIVQELNSPLVRNYQLRGWGTKQALTTIQNIPSLYSE